MPATVQADLTYILCKHFFFGEESQRFEAAFAADAGVFHAAERRAQVAQKPAVDPDDAGFEFGGDAVRTREVLGPQRRRQAVADAVGVARAPRPRCRTA